MGLMENRGMLEVLVPTIHVGCSHNALNTVKHIAGVLVPTIHVGCSGCRAAGVCSRLRSFSTHDTRGL